LRDFGSRNHTHTPLGSWQKFSRVVWLSHVGRMASCHVGVLPAHAAIPYIVGVGPPPGSFRYFLDLHLRLEVQGLYHVLPRLPPVSQTLPMQCWEL